MSHRLKLCQYKRVYACSRVLEVVCGRLQIHSFLRVYFFSLCVCVYMCSCRLVCGGQKTFLISHPPCIFETGLTSAWIFSEMILLPP